MRTPEQRADVRRRYAAVDTSNVADVLDTLGLPDQGLSPELFPASGSRLAGWAYTIAGASRPYSGGGDPAKMEACAGISDGEVAVWAGDGHGICYFGELIALGLRERGCAGSVVDGGVRDLRWLAEHEIPVFARYRTPVQSIGRWAVTSWQQPVSVRGATSAWVRVAPGDFVLADEDGVVVVPDAVVERVLEEAERLTATEVEVRAALAGGLSLSAALERFGHV